MRRVIAVLTVAAALTGCSSSGGGTGVTNEPPAGVNRPAETPAAPAEQLTAASTSAAPVNPKFGQAYNYENGLSVTVSPPQPYTPSSSAAVGEPKPSSFVQFTVTVVNKTQGNYEPPSFSMSMQSGNTEQQQVFDSAKGVGGSPQTALLPGRETQFKVAFGASDPGDLVLQVRPGFEYEAVLFTN